MTPSVFESVDFVADKASNDSHCIPNEKLITGSHESILLLGSDAQSELRDCSRKVARMTVNSAFDFDITISEVLTRLEDFEKSTEQAGTVHSAIIRQRAEKRVIVRCKEVLNYLEKITLFFQLQQSQLIKESALLKQLDAAFQKSGIRLKECIEKADNFISESDIAKLQGEELFWLERLKKRTEDLRISYTLSLQGRAQLKLLLQNNVLLIDKISSVVSNTIPLWQSRMSIMLGIKLSEKQLDVQEKVLKAAENQLKKTSKSLKHHRIDFDEAAEVNENLQRVLKDIELSEKQDFKVRKDIQKLLG